MSNENLHTAPPTLPPKKVTCAFRFLSLVSWPQKNGFKSRRSHGPQGKPAYDRQNGMTWDPLWPWPKMNGYHWGLFHLDISGVKWGAYNFQGLLDLDQRVQTTPSKEKGFGLVSHDIVPLVFDYGFLMFKNFLMSMSI